MTDSNGMYTMTGVSPGTYCAVIYIGDIPNDSILIPGSWTYPTAGIEIAQQEVIMVADEVITDINFGWDYQFLPAQEESSSDKGKFYKNAWCRLGPGTVYDTATAFEKGREFEILARSEKHLPLWLYIEELLLKMRCWISAEVAEFDVDPELIPTKIARPTPTPVVCHEKMGKEDCENAGGFYFVGGAAASCICP
jgi:hypothetical protein